LERFQNEREISEVKWRILPSLKDKEAQGAIKAKKTASEVLKE